MIPKMIVSWLSAASILFTALAVSALPIDERSPAAALVPAVTSPQIPIAAGTYPRSNKLSDGSLIASYTAFANGDSIISFARSTDGGSTWAPLGTAAQGPTATTDIDNPYVLQLPTGRILVAYRNHNRADATTYSFFRITLSYSDDGGATWAYLCDPASDPGPVNGNWEPFLRLATDGSLQLYYSRENSATDQDNLMRTSTDGGATWSDSSIVTGAGTDDQRDGMIGVTSVNGGANLIAVFETGINNVFSINAVTSSDDGHTWTNRHSVYVPSNNNNAGGPQVINVGGTLVASFYTSEDTGVAAQTDCKVVTSGDGGQTWGNEVLFAPVRSVWAGLTDLDNSNFLALADYNGASVYKMALN